MDASTQTKLERFASKHKIILEEGGMVGFGRPSKNL